MRGYAFILILSLLSVLSLDSGSHFGVLSNVRLIESAEAQTQSFEPYSVRPRIESVKAEKHELPKIWSELKKAHLSLIIQLYVMYPEHHLYFLARDAELLYDTSKILSKRLPGFDPRLHLLNISRANMRKEHIKEYLEQEGISDETLKAGRKILFIDTGFAGTIPSVILSYFDQKYHAQMKTQLVVSSNVNHPSSRVFLRFLNSATNEISPSQLHGTIVSYEHMPRYTDRSTYFARIENRWQPMSSQNFQSDGSVSREIAEKYQGDLKEFLTSNLAQEQMARELRLWQLVKSILKQEDQKKKESLKKFLMSTNDKDLRESIVRDALNIDELNLGGDIVYRPSIGLSETVGQKYPNKLDLKEKYPQFKEILEDPPSQIQKLIAQDEITTLGALFDVVNDQEIISIFAKALAGVVPTKAMKALIMSLIEKGNQTILWFLARYTFPKAQFADMKDHLRLLIEKSDLHALDSLAHYYFSEPHTKDMEDLIIMLIKKANYSTLYDLANHAFSQPHTMQMKTALELLIQKGGSGTWSRLAQYAFSKPHSKEWKDLLRLIIEKGDENTLQYLARNTFSQPHTAEMVDLINLMIKRADSTTLTSLAHYTFSHPHTRHMGDAVSALIKKGNFSTHCYLAQYTFSQAHTRGMQEQLSQLVAVNNPYVSELLAQFTFSKPHTKDMESSILELIKQGSSDTHKLLAQYTFSQPHTKNMDSLIYQLIERADFETLRYLAQYTFSQPHTVGMLNSLRLLVARGNDSVISALVESALSQPHSQKWGIIREAIKIHNSSLRREFLEANPVGSLLSDGQPLGTKFIAGETLNLQGKELTVVSYIDQGRRGIVYKVMDKAGRYFALKIAKNDLPETLDSLNKEVKKAQQLKTLKIPYATIILTGPNYVLKNWIEGLRGDEVIRRVLAGDMDKKVMTELFDMAHKVMTAGAYIGDFRPKNLIYSGRAWFVVDSGGISEGLTFEEARAKFNEKFERRWQMPLAPACSKMF